MRRRFGRKRRSFRGRRGRVVGRRRRRAGGKRRSLRNRVGIRM